MAIMEECIPKKTLPPWRNLPWLRKNTKNAMRKRDTIFKESGYSAKYRSARNRVTNMLRRAKADYFKPLNPRDSKKFWKAVKYLNKQQSTIPTLQQGELIATTDLDKAETLNSFFSSCFNDSHPPLMAPSSDSSTLLSIMTLLMRCIALLVRSHSCCKTSRSLKLVDWIGSQLTCSKKCQHYLSEPTCHWL